MVVLGAPWRTLAPEQIKAIISGDCIVFHDGSVVARKDGRWHLICFACDKRGDAGVFVDAVK